MKIEGILIGAVSFLVIGMFHPLVIKGEYYFGKKVWPFFLIVGIGCIALSLFLENWFLSAVVGVVGFSSLWSIHEIIQQEERVKKGWFPRNPNRIVKE